jgi:APA family basic amino acid/polyamine antiporter
MAFRIPAVKDLFRKKSIRDLSTSTGGEHALKKVLGPLELIFFGVGAIIGTGIFVITGVVAADYAGPALAVSFVLSGAACLFAALCYAEFAAMVPVAGSAYTYSYASLGEIWAWIIGWDLILEYSVSIAVVAIGWSGYMASFLIDAGLPLPAALVNPPGVDGGFINIPAILIISLITLLLISGVKGSARVNSAIVAIKISVVLLFIFLGVGYINPENWTPFAPFGWGGVVTGAAIVFFAYIGFDAVSTTAEEVKNPGRDLPIGILVSLVICTVLYITVSLILTGIVPYTMLSTSAPVAFALEFIGISWGAEVIAIGAVLGITSVMLVLLYGQSRIFFAMSRDGLLPRTFSKVHPVLRTPVRVTVLVGVVTALLAGFLPLESLAELVNIGTLAAFIIVAIGIIVLRRTSPDTIRPFRCPFVPLIPLLAVGFCSYLILALPTITHLRFVVWLFIGLLIYFLYGSRRAGLAARS